MCILPKDLTTRRLEFFEHGHMNIAEVESLLFFRNSGGILEIRSTQQDPSFPKAVIELSQYM